MSEWELPASVEAQSIERVGGSYAWESGVYDATVKMVYLNQSEGGAVSFNAVLQNSSGKELKEAMWIKSGNAKGNKTYYTDKDGKDRPLPGYSVANSLCVAVTGESLAKCMESAEKKTINIYSAKDGKEMPTERPVLMGLVNKAIKVAVHQISEDQTTKNEAGQYVANGKTRTVNECKFFGNAEGKTADEILEGKDATMFDKWAEKNTGTVIDKTSKKDSATQSAADIMGGNSATPAADGASSGSLFS
jgi:hypothetical protein